MTSLQTTVRIGITNGEWKRQNHVRVPRQGEGGGVTHGVRR